MSVVNNLKVLKDCKIVGNLDVQGTTTSLNVENVNIQDASLYINKNYVNTGTAKAGHLVVNNKAVTAADAITSISSGTITVTTGSLLAVGDFVELSGLDKPEEDGLYRVLTVPLATTVTLDTANLASPYDFFQLGDPSDQATAGGTITHVKITCMTLEEDGVMSKSYGQTGTDLATNKSILQTTNPNGLITTESGASFTPTVPLYKTYVMNNTGAVTFTLPPSGLTDGASFDIIAVAGSVVTVTTTATNKFENNQQSGPIVLDEESQKLQVTYSLSQNTYYIR
jgi:hypothetical protein